MNDFTYISSLSYFPLANIASYIYHNNYISLMIAFIFIILFIVKNNKIFLFNAVMFILYYLINLYSLNIIPIIEPNKPVMEKQIVTGVIGYIILVFTITINIIYGLYELNNFF